MCVYICVEVVCIYIHIYIFLIQGYIFYTCTEGLDGEGEGGGYGGYEVSSSSPRETFSPE